MEGKTNLRVLLHDLPVGTLVLTASDGTEFRLLESYKQVHPRPVLGQTFLDDLDQVQRSRARVPPWFSNLLPEGPLRELLAKEAGVHTSREFFLLKHLGDDLPGAVRILPDEYFPEIVEFGGANEQAGQEDLDWHFSLAGVQLKFSARRAERGLTVPVSGRGGDWIVKLPDSRYPKVPENEYATMRWAEASGVSVPEVELVEVAQIAGLPASLKDFKEKRALAVRRFDRLPGGQRVHMEDFAQVLSLYPDEKYERYNYETLANLVYSLSGSEGVERFVRQLVFIVASGNGDAHHKNWSLLYRDGVRAELSPAYDLVSTVRYKADDTLALNLARSKRWEDVTLQSFLRMARKIGEDEGRMREYVSRATAAVMAAWESLGGEFGYERETRAVISRHMERVPLFQRPQPILSLSL